MSSTCKQWWLIGHQEEILTGSRLPSKGQVLRMLYFHHSLETKTKADAAKKTVEGVMQIWEKAGLPTSILCYSKTKLLMLVEAYERLKKHKKRASKTARMNEEMFQGELDDLFDVAHRDALEKTVNQEDRAFLISQRDDRSTSSMTGLDTVSAKIYEKKRKRKEEETKRKQAAEVAKQIASIIMPSSQVVSSHSSTCEETDGSDAEFKCLSLPKRRSENKYVKILSKELTTKLDRYKVSNPAAMTVVGAVAKATSQNIGKVTLSTSSIRRHRMKNRKEMAITEKIELSDKRIVLLHWDAKQLPNIAGGRKRVERLAIHVTGGDKEYLLEAAKIPRGTGHHMAEAALQAVSDVGIEGRIQGIVFDTTASNTGRNEGACGKIQEGLGKNLLWFACRHHILEVILGDVFKLCYGPSGGPNVPLFVRFRDQWDSLDQNYWTSSMDEESLRPLLTGELSDTRETALSKLKNAIEHGSHPRDDYKELLVLSYIFLGGSIGTTFKMRAPGGFHQARWMSKGIYALKIFLFRSQFRLTSQELKAMELVSLFVALLYAIPWNEAVVPSHAAYNDLLFMRELCRGIPNERVAEVALKAFKRHLWYVSEELVPLSLFDERVANEEKASMIQNMERKGNGLKRLDGKTFNPNKPLSGFFSSQSRKVLDLMLPGQGEELVTLLAKNPASWEDDPIFCRMKKAIDEVKVVNDVAERGVALMTTFNAAITREETQKQFLLKVVAKDRKEWPTTSKAALIENEQSGNQSQ